ncbi:hypothetical protein [Limosilactobacillus vaginalis]|uniref:hypothetical protein n=1 Tax=Limosilactobacillus vaginalis TaxID=1633 RepID=UPI0024B8BB4B|nr:hypothetical protein [Limosilactobacillus vaginalis]
MIYVLCPGNFKSGGPELLHQLVAQINSFKHHHAKIAYFDYRSKEVPYDKELINYVDDDWVLEDNVIDSSDNIVVIPEMNVEKAKKYPLSKKYIWWMSVDNYKYTNKFRDMVQTKGIIHAVSWSLKGKGYNKDSLVRSVDLNLCQSCYAKNYILNELKIPMKKIKYLSDYINDEYLKNYSKSLEHKKSNVVLYNPKKGISFTKKLIKKSTNIKWIPLINMTNREIHEALQSAKVYIDFGDHPGKDRLPREAAINGCCIITDKEGSAFYQEDVPIPEEYKLERNDTSINSILNRINDCLENYSERINDFSNYRNFILSEKDRFNDDVKRIFLD